MCVFVFDRYLSVFWRYFYPKHKVKFTVGFSVVSWLIVIVSNILFLPGLLDCFAFDDLKWVCTRSARLALWVFVSTCLSWLSQLQSFQFSSTRDCSTWPGESRNTQPKVSEGEAARKIQQRERKTSYFLLAFHHGSRVHTSKCTDCDYSYDHIFQIGWISASYAIYLRSGILRCDIHMTITDPLVIMRNEHMRQILASAIQKWNPRHHD